MSEIKIVRAEGSALLTPKGLIPQIILILTTADINGEFMANSFFGMFCTACRHNGLHPVCSVAAHQRGLPSIIEFNTDPIQKGSRMIFTLVTPSGKREVRDSIESSRCYQSARTRIISPIAN